MALIAARILPGGGEVKTAPATAALNMPTPMYPKNNYRQSHFHVKVWLQLFV